MYYKFYFALNFCLNDRETLLFMLLLFKFAAELGVFTFDTSGDLSQLPEGRCFLWTTRMQANLSNILPLVKNLTSCPCNGFQALLSPVHVWIPNTNCFTSLENLPVSQYVGMVNRPAYQYLKI